MTTTTDTAATAAIGAATKQLRLPVVRSDAQRLAEVAPRSQLSYLGFLAECSRLRSTSAQNVGASAGSGRPISPG